MVKSKILVAVEPNEEAQHVWRSAAQFGQQAWPDAEVTRHALSVVAPIVEVYADLNFAPLAKNTATWSKEIQQAQAAELVRQLAATDADLDADSQVKVVEGYPAPCISEVAADYDLVVMGLHNRHGLRKMLGSTTHSVLNQCDKDLLAIHPNSDHPQGYRKILICVDSTAMASHILEQSIGLLGQVDDYEVLSVIPPINSIYTSVYGDFGLGADYAAIEQQLMEHAQSRITELVNSAGLDATKVTTLKGDPVNTICDRAADNGADLVLMGANQRSALNRLMLGSTCRGVLQSTPADTLILRFPND